MSGTAAAAAACESEESSGLAVMLARIGVVGTASARHALCRLSPRADPIPSKQVILRARHAFCNTHLPLSYKRAQLPRETLCVGAQTHE